MKPPPAPTAFALDPSSWSSEINSFPSEDIHAKTLSTYAEGDDKLTLTRGGNGVGKSPPPNFGKSRLGVRGGKRKKVEKKKEGEEKMEKEKKGKERKKKRKREREEKEEKIVN